MDSQPGILATPYPAPPSRSHYPHNFADYYHSGHRWDNKEAKGHPVVGWSPLNATGVNTIPHRIRPARTRIIRKGKVKVILYHTVAANHDLQGGTWSSSAGGICRIILAVRTRFFCHAPTRNKACPTDICRLIGAKSSNLTNRWGTDGTHAGGNTPVGASTTGKVGTKPVGASITGVAVAGPQALIKIKSRIPKITPIRL